MGSLRWVFLTLIRFYQICVSPLKPKSCRFVPTCSEYAIQSISRFGALKGGWLTMKRLAKCGPWHPGGVDEVPQLK